MTKYEQKIYEIVNASDEHLTAEEIFENMRGFYENVALATVYNNLNKLWNAGLIRKLSIEGQADRYDRIEKHDHLVCRRCGRITDIRLADLTASLESQLGQKPEFYDLKVYYLCPECKKSDME